MPQYPSNVVRNGDTVTISTAADQWTLRVADIVGVGVVSRTEISIATRLVTDRPLILLVPWTGAADRDRVREFATDLLTPAE